MRDPVAAEVAFFEHRRAFNLTRDQWLRSCRNKEPIDDARELVAPHEQSRPAQRGAVGYYLAFKMSRVCGRGCPLGRLHEAIERLNAEERT